VPDAVAWALPGAVNAELGLEWDGDFQASAMPLGGKDRLLGALGRRDVLDPALAELARASGGDATLFTWVTSLEADVLSSQNLPGEVVDTIVGPVFVDVTQEPFVVQARIGMALVTRDGEVVVRYEDEYSSLLTEDRSATWVGRDLARRLAEEVALVWATDPRLKEAEGLAFAE